MTTAEVKPRDLTSRDFRPLILRHLAKILAAAGFALALWLFLRDSPASIVTLLGKAGPGLILAALVHVLPMTLNAQAWRLVLPGATRPHLPAMVWAVWIRESVNGLLPVARIGGELASYRLLRHLGARRAFAVAGLTVDMALSIVSQLVFALLGVAALIVLSPAGEASKFFAASGRNISLIGGLVLLALLVGLFIAAQWSGIFGRMMRMLNRLAAGRFDAAVGQSAQIDRAVRAIYRSQASIVGCILWQMVGWAAGGLEIWVALQFLDVPIGLTEAVSIEAVIQAVSSAAFVIPGALGVQEVAFVFVGAALGLEPASALALAAARRIRDGVIFIPGLISWQMAENRIARRGDI